ETVEGWAGERESDDAPIRGELMPVQPLQFRQSFAHRSVLALGAATDSDPKESLVGRDSKGEFRTSITAAAKKNPRTTVRGRERGIRASTGGATRLDVSHGRARTGTRNIVGGFRRERKGLRPQTLSSGSV